jgi:surface-anchored protein
MLRAAIFVFTATFTLMGARAEDIRVFVSNTTGASQYIPAVGPGYVVRPAPHLDLNVIWNADTQTFSGGFRTDDETPVVQFGPEDAIAYLPATGQRQRDDDSEQYNFQGAMDATYWTFPSSADASNNAFTLYLGFSAYGVPRNGTFTGSGASSTDRIRWTVHSVENLTTPSATAFYGYSVPRSGPVNMQLTLDPAYPNREMVMLGLGHTHLNLLFKAPGMYRITFRVRGTLVATGQEVSSLVPVYFGIEEWQIPASTVSYTAWRDTEFSTQQAADPMVSGPEADPDNDGFANLEEFAFGGDPLVPDASLLTPRLERAVNSWILTVRQRTNASGLTITPVATASLQPGLADWRADLLAPHGQPRNVAEGIDEFDYLLNGSLTERAFLRVRTQLAAP